ncbi:MAG: TetR/AcrR family transcriptional regulator [Alphaproteobacteria bacterium]|nr:TetR/AcrR family transcriptional regulator [Alphaproteobacteria bacterium]
MSPRRYDMKDRKASIESTRRRILDATVKLHGERGIFGTSWQDIAAAADVSVGTVYKHFPSINELVPACGDLLMERIQPPRPEDAEEIIGDAKRPAERLAKVANTLFEFYERGGAHLDADLRERELPMVKEWEDYLRAMVAHFVRVALSELAPGERQTRAIGALFDFPSFRAMRARGITPADAAVQAVEMAVLWIEAQSNTSKQEERP